MMTSLIATPEIATPEKQLNVVKEEEKQNKIVIFDWDDTIFPTSVMFKQQNNENITVNIADLKTLSEKVLILLNKYCSIYGDENVFIVTNGEQKWIFQSLQYIITYCMKHKIENSFISIDRLLINGKIRSISANDLYSKQYPEKTMLWKYLVFHQIVYHKFFNDNNHDINNKQYTLISIGDSSNEYIASKNIAIELKNRYNINITLHRLKLTENPTISTMNEQFRLIVSLGNILKTKTNDTNIDYEAEEKAHCHGK